MDAPRRGWANNPAFAIFAYCASSILMTVTNKYIFSGLDWNLNFLLLAVQAIICVLALNAGRLSGAISYRPFKRDEALAWLPISFALVGMLFTGAKALHYISIPVYTIFKNLTIILIAVGETFMFGTSITALAFVSFGLMVVSSIVAAGADVQAALRGPDGSATVSTLNMGYLWLLVNCICSAGYVLGMRKRITLTKFEDFDTMYYNNLLSIPILAVCSLLFEDLSRDNLALNFPEGKQAMLLWAILLSGLSAVFISYTTAWCLRVTSSATFSMVGALNKLPVAASGLVFFDAPVTVASIGALNLGVVSGILYAVAKIRQKRQQAGPPAAYAPLADDEVALEEQPNGKLSNGLAHDSLERPKAEV